MSEHNERIDVSTHDQRAVLVGGVVSTEDDVELLRDEATMRGFMAMDFGDNPFYRQKQVQLDHLADRIASLLPPREPESKP